ncbi:thiol reductant ABC exporter subunit CydC [Pseudolysinimonas kribbensis]|uniref:thiol reductant ABC exporter subunit CydC n=1 Tax=Pseudolysinimonas kribbensis TaxID=433641 RepID=UPI0031D696D2
MGRTRITADIGPGARAGIAALTALAGLRAVALVLIAGSIAAAVTGIAAGHAPTIAEVLPGVAGVLLRAVASWASGALAGRIAAATKRRWRERLVRHVAAEGGRGAEEALLAGHGLDDLDAYLGTVLPAAVSALVIPAALGLRILISDPLSALIVAVTLPLVPVFMVLIGLHSRERADAAASALTRLAEHLVELAEGLPVLVGLGRAAEQTGALAAVQDGYRRRLQRTLRSALLSALALELVGMLSVAVVAVTLGLRLLSGSVGLDAALLVLLLAPDCFSALREVGAAYHQAQDGLAALRRVRAVLDRTRAVAERRLGRPGLVGLTVRHPGRATVGPVNARLPRRGVVAVTGPSGAGKSTLLDAIAGIAGAGAEVDGAVVGIPRDGIAMVRQTPRFAAATPLAELALVGPGHGQVLAELDLAGLGDAPIGRLSPGEQRRLAVARALARADAGARVLVLDEPTAHLDAVNAERVLAAVRRRAAPLLVLVSSHDPRMRADAGLVIDLGGAATAGEAAWMPPAISAEPAGGTVAAPAVAPVEPSPAAPAATRTPRAPHAVARWLLAILLGAIASGMSLALTAVSGWLIVRAAAEPAIMYLLVAIVGVRFFGLGRAVARYAERLVGHAAALALVDRLRLRLWTGLAERGAAARGARDAGRALDLLVNLPAQLRDLLPRVLTPLAGGVLVTLASAAVVTAVAPTAWPVAVALAVTGVVAPLLAWLAGRRDQRALVAGATALTTRVAALADAADDLRAVGADAAAVDVVDRLGRMQERRERRQASVAAAASLVAGIGTGTAAVLAPLLAPTAEAAAVAALLVLACLEPVASAAVAAQRIPALRAVLSRLAAGGASGTAGAAVAAAGADLPPVVRRLALRDLALAWDDGRPVVTGLDAEVVAPGWLVVDGASGAGKTTLVTALLGDLRPAHGAVLAGGSDLRDVDRDAWRARVAWCPQEAHVFDSTVRANLLVARPRTDPVTEDEMHAVLASVGLDRVVADAAEGLDLRVGRHGSALSGGERQRLAVARAILRRCDVLVLDEPTAHLDDATADAVMRDVRRAAGDRIVVLVSHRAADRLPEDRVLTLGRSRLPVAE